MARHYINLTPRGIRVYAQKQFVALEQSKQNTLIADGVEGSPLLDLPSQGNAWIATERVAVCGELFPTYHIQYGDPTGLPESIGDGEILVVSLPTKSRAAAAGHPLVNRMVSPYRVVRSRQNGSIVLGCMGFTF